MLQMSWGNTNSTVTLTFVLWPYDVLNKSNLIFTKLLGWGTYSYNMKFMSNPCSSSLLLEFFWSWFPAGVLVSNLTLSLSLFLASCGGKGCALCGPGASEGWAEKCCSILLIQIHSTHGYSIIRDMLVLWSHRGWGRISKQKGMPSLHQDYI